MTFKDQVAKGAALLDKHRPGWAGYVDMRRLNMGIGTCSEVNMCGCVLSQVDIYLGRAHVVDMMRVGNYDNQMNSLVSDAGLRGPNYRPFPDRYALAVAYGFTVDSENLTSHEPEECWRVLTQEWVEAIKERLRG